MKTINKKKKKKELVIRENIIRKLRPVCMHVEHVMSSSDLYTFYANQIVLRTHLITQSKCHQSFLIWSDSV